MDHPGTHPGRSWMEHITSLDLHFPTQQQQHHQPAMQSRREGFLHKWKVNQSAAHLSTLHHIERIGTNAEAEQVHRACPTNCLLLKKKFQGPAHLVPSRTAPSSSSHKAALFLTFEEVEVSSSFSSSFTMHLHLPPKQLTWHSSHIQQSCSPSKFISFILPFTVWL